MVSEDFSIRVVGLRRFVTLCKTAPYSLTYLFVLKLIPAFFGFACKITISRLQTWSDMVRCSSMRSDAVRCGN